jgi:hypothetical protein
MPIELALARWRRAGPAAAGDLAALRAAWPAAAGAQAARRSIPVRQSRAGVLTVACESAVWAQELNAARDAIQARLAARAPAVRLTGIRFVVGDHALRAEAAPERSPARPTAAERASAEAAVEDVSDPELRARLARAAAGTMAVARQRAKSLQRGKKAGRDGRHG